jgi:hypothetical protein
MEGAHFAPKENFGGEQEITVEQRRAIDAAADLRRREHLLHKKLDTPDRIKEFDDFVNQQQIEILPNNKEEQTETARDSMTRAREAPTPASAALLYVRAAHALYSIEEPFDSALAKARLQLDKAYRRACNDITDFLPEALLLRLDKELAKENLIPSPEHIVQMVSDEKLLKSYALILPDEDRERLLAHVPAQSRKGVTRLLDRSVSEILPERFFRPQPQEQEQDKNQRAQVYERAKRDLTESLGQITEQETLGTIRTLAQTIRNLEGQDGKDLLEALGEESLRGVKRKELAGALDVKPEDLPYETLKERNRLRVSHAARVLYELAKLDLKHADTLTMKFLGKSEVPDRLFRFFLLELTDHRSVTRAAERYVKVQKDATPQRRIEEKRNLSFLRKLIAQYPNQVNTVLDTLAQIQGYEPHEHEREIFQALHDLDSLTPRIFGRYRSLQEGSARKAFGEKIRALRKNFFANRPIGDLLDKSDQDIMIEMVYLAYQPIGMDFKAVERFVNDLEDHTGDIEGYQFPQDGYPFTLSSVRAYAVREGKEIDLKKIKNYRAILQGPDEFKATEEKAKEQVDKKEAEKKLAEKCGAILESLSKGTSDFSDKDLATLLILINKDEFIRSFSERYRSVTPQNAYSYLNELKEIFGVYFSDNYPKALENFFRQNPTVDGHVAKILSSVKRAETLQRLLGKDENEIAWDKLDARSERAKLLSTFLATRVLKKITEGIRRESNKFEESEEGEQMQDTKTNLKAYISKNVGSFFAKASAGICTADDVMLFKRKDHFHINIVENDQTVRGNVQAYMIDDGGKKSLVLRGFNPNTDFLMTIDPKAFCEAVLGIGKGFVKDNGLHKLYITESLGVWHALSNRPPVTSYLEKRYAKQATAKRYSLKIASEKLVSTIYEIVF